MPQNKVKKVESNSKRSPFRQQVSEYDCVPTTFINALICLFDRNEIPPLVVQKIYIYCLDSVTSHNNIGYGTTDLAIQLLGQWLEEYRHKKFVVKTSYCIGKAVSFKKNNILVKNRSVVMLRVTHKGNYWHYILGLHIIDEWIYCYDPYPKTTRANKNGCYEFIDQSTPHSANLKIHLSWLDTNSNKNIYQLGSKVNRECLLLWRE